MEEYKNLFFLYSYDSILIEIKESEFNFLFIQADTDENYLIYILNTSKMIFNKTKFSYNNIINYIMIKEEYSFIHFDKCNFTNNFISDNSFIIEVNSETFLENIYIENNTFKSAFFLYFGNLKKILSLLILDKLTFVNNSGLSIIIGDAFLQNSMIIFQKIIFISNNMTDSIIKLYGFIQINCTELMFEENIAKNHIEIYETEILLIKIFLCFKKNATNIICEFCGSCLQISMIKLFFLENSEIRHCSSNIMVPGILIFNPPSLNGKIQIFDFISYGNIRNSSNSFSFYGVSLSIKNEFEVIINQSYFYRNRITLLKEIYGAPAIVFISIYGNISILKSFFEENYSNKGSLSLNFNGFNLSITDSYFTKLIQKDLNENSVVLVIGKLNYLYLFNCIFSNNQAFMGLLILNDRNITNIFFDSIILFHNYESQTFGIHISSETKYKVINWKNSLIFENFGFDALLIYAYTPYYQLNILFYFFNNSILNNYNDSNVRYGNLFILWIYTGVAESYIKKCNFINNSINVLATIFGIKSVINFNINNCIVQQNFLYNMLETYYTNIYCFENILISNIGDTNSQLFYAVRSNISIENNYIEGLKNIGRNTISKELKK